MMRIFTICTSPNIICVIKSRRMKWAGYVARVGERKSACGILMVRSDGRRPFGKHRLQWQIILKWIFMKWDGKA